MEGRKEGRMEGKKEGRKETLSSDNFFRPVAELDSTVPTEEEEE